MQKQKQTYIRVISFLGFLCVVLCVSTVVFSVRAGRYKNAALLSSRRAASELCENLDSITVNLEKSLFCNSRLTLASLGTELYKSAAAAKVGLGQLTNETIESDGVYKFLSQVGDYTLSLNKKDEAKETLSAEERRALSSLYEYSQALSSGLGELMTGTYDETVSFEKQLSTLDLEKKESALNFFDGFNDTEQALTDYPTLVYDGPFADSVLQRDAAFVASLEPITEAQAKKTAAKLLSCRETQLHTDGEEEGTPALYCFSKGEKSIGITKNGGLLCYITNPDLSLEAAIGEEQASSVAEAFLQKCGYDSMKKSYYSTYDGVCTVNFAFEKGGVVYYADLIKVSVALDSGEVVAVDARAYLTNHCERTLPKISCSAKKAKSLVSKELTLKKTALALIPGKDGKERLCHEFHVADKNGREALVYIDVQTGKEAEVLLLLYSDGGVLTR